MIFNKRIYKQCKSASGQTHWLLTAIRFLRSGDTFKHDDIIYLATSDPFISEATKQYTIKFVRG